MKSLEQSTLTRIVSTSSSEVRVYGRHIDILLGRAIDGKWKKKDRYEDTQLACQIKLSHEFSHHVNTKVD